MSVEEIFQTMSELVAEQFAMESRRDTKKLRANKQALLDAWEKMGR